MSVPTDIGSPAPVLGGSRSAQGLQGPRPILLPDARQARFSMERGTHVVHDEPTPDGHVFPRPDSLTVTEAEAIYDQCAGTWEDGLRHLAFVMGFISFDEHDHATPSDLWDYALEFDRPVTLIEAVRSIRKDDIPERHRDALAKTDDLVSACSPHAGGTASFIAIARVFRGISESLFDSYRLRTETPLRALYALLADPFMSDVPFARDRCVLVRVAIASSNFFSQEDSRVLQADSIGVVRNATGLSAESDWDGESVLSCRCELGLTELENLFGNKDATVPNPGSGLTPFIRQVDVAAWSTQESPSPIEDYSFRPELVEYLKSPIPNQFSMGHAGHSANSYALSSRFALGPFAGVFQVHWGGAFGDPVRQLEEWGETSDILQAALERIQWRDHSLLKPNFSLVKRNCVILYSALRDVCEIHTRIGETDEWEELECDSLDSLFAAVNEQIAHLMPNPPVIP